MHDARIAQNALRGRPAPRAIHCVMIFTTLESPKNAYGQRPCTESYTLRDEICTMQESPKTLYGQTLHSRAIHCAMRFTMKESPKRLYGKAFRVPRAMALRDEVMMQESPKNASPWADLHREPYIARDEIFTRKNRPKTLYGQTYLELHCVMRYARCKNHPKRSMGRPFT
ncbi:hypothetical protein AVEN_71914-1 [Araneus ventricosus]|uniref:Uncharacterized protein n=1 Tax=Araneus ventricosus TaxID=182803 RepID=A0A4Y2VI99_ARAVE|nr:hypothetical protein AVEN_71914-1 [Araneus ventricosus]